MGWFTIEDKPQAGQPQAAATASYDAGASGVYEAPSVFDNSYSDPKAEKLGEDLLRWSLCSLSVNLAIAICFAVAWIPGVDWFSIAYFNGNPEQGQNVGIVGGCLIWTTVDPLGWNGAAFTFTDIEEADIMCNGPLITSENCQGLMNKLNCHNLYSILFSLALTCLLPGIVWSCWLIHQLRFGTLERVQDQAMIGYWGCITSSTKWWADPCTFIYLQTITFVPMVLFGIPAWPIAMSFTMRFWIAFGGLWFGGAQTIFGVQGELSMTEGYDLMCCGTVLLIVALACGVKLRDTYRELVYCGGIDTSEDATQFGNVVMENILGRARSFTKVLNYIPTITFGGGDTTTTSDDAASRDRSASSGGAIRDRSASTAPPRDRSQSSAPPPSGGNREYSKSTLDQMIPSEAEMMGGQGGGDGGFDPGAMSQGFGKGGGGGHPTSTSSISSSSSSKWCSTNSMRSPTWGHPTPLERAWGRGCKDYPAQNVRAWGGRARKAKHLGFSPPSPLCFTPLLPFSAPPFGPLDTPLRAPPPLPSPARTCVCLCSAGFHS